MHCSLQLCSCDHLHTHEHRSTTTESNNSREVMHGSGMLEVRVTCTLLVMCLHERRLRGL